MVIRILNPDRYITLPGRPHRLGMQNLKEKKINKGDYLSRIEKFYITEEQLFANCQIVIM